MLLAVALIARGKALENLVDGGVHIVFRQQEEARDLHKPGCRPLASM